MIFTLFINLASWVIGFIGNLLPTSTGYPQAVEDATLYFGQNIGMLNPIIPLDTLGAVLAIIISVEIGIFAFKTAKWVFSHVPVIGGKG